MLLIKNVQILEKGFSGYKDILIDEGKIIRISENIDNHEAEILEAHGMYVLPGFVCSHHHIYSALARGITAHIPASDNFISVLNNLWWRLDRVLDEESIYYSAVVACSEALKNGTTSIVDHHASPGFIAGSLDIISKVMDDFGIRGILSYEITNRNGIEDVRKGIEENLSFITKNESNKMKRGSVGIHAPFTVDDNDLSEIAEILSKVDTGIHIHVSEDRFDSSFSSFKSGISPVRKLHNFSLLNNKALIVHGVYLKPEEIDIINSLDCFLIHNPRSNMNNCVGYAKRLDLIKNVAVGTDGIGSNMPEELQFAFFKANDSGVKNAWNNSFKYLMNGNMILERYFREKFGAVSEGYSADLILLDYHSPTPLTADNLSGHLYFGLSSAHVDTVVIDGKIVMKNRKLPQNIDKLMKESAICATKLWKRMDKIK